MHVERTRRLRNGETLSGITAELTRRLGIGSRILPMTDDPVRTRVETRDGVLDFQHYFVGRQCVPAGHQLCLRRRRRGGPRIRMSWPRCAIWVCAP